MPVVYYRVLISVAFGRKADDSVFDDLSTRAKKLEEIAAK